MGSELNLYQRMAAATMEIRRVAKNLFVDAGKASYKAVGEADILEAVKPAEEKCGIYSYPVSREIIESAVLSTETETRGEKRTRKQQFMRIKTVYRFVNIDAPDEYIEITSYGDGVDSQDKAPGKAMTYSDKYALMKAYKITTGDDPDQKASEPLVEKVNNVPGISEKQVNYIKRLHDENAAAAKFLEDTYPDGVGHLTMAEASELIGALKDGIARTAK